MFLRSIVKKTTSVNIRSYSTSSSNASGGSFYYRYGTPLVKCTVLASATTMAYQLLWQHLEYQEYRDNSEKHINELETRIKSLEESGEKVATA
ncbi:hypothetical protein BDA99DRAFT_499796 [Phascolomyces articulosus]|uniref:Uncharacterized protein n=1 Tax=Phascolomyces articulosus TaxID=60185 RepID=A0AAD5K7Y2_9FUNG|nr:hypothetical protein BDA99DRAFT_499796 [Phascolomyces articulosus]